MMNRNDTEILLRNVAEGKVTIDEALLKLRSDPIKDIDIAKLDNHRGLRQGIGEVIYGAGKSPEQIDRIAHALWEDGQRTILITRMSREAADRFRDDIPFTYYEDASAGVVGEMMPKETEGYILVITAGTSDIPVAEEAAITAETLGNRVERVYDAGVAGIHRLLKNTDVIMKANVIVAIAGMEGALASVVGGLADCPVIAVPTSIGYGTSFGGVTALLAMLNSCASGVSVVNIDNGFGAGFLASMINHKGVSK